MRRYTTVTQFPVDTFSQDRGSEEPGQKSLLTTVLIPLGSVLVAGLGLLVQNVPWWVTAIVVFYIVVVALAGFIPASIRLYRKVRGLMANRAIARRYRPLVRRYLTTLMANLEESRSDTVFNVWKNAVSLDQGQVNIRPDYAHLRTLRSWLASIDVRLTGNRKRDFELLCDELAEVVLQYSKLCEQAHREIEAVVVNSKPEEHRLRNLKQEWNNARDKHNQTVKAWEDLAKNINHDAGQRVCFDHCGFIKTIG